MRFLNVLGPEVTIFFVTAAFVLLGTATMTLGGAHGSGTSTAHIFTDMIK